MQSLEMSGSYPLSDEAVDEELTRTSPGNYDAFGDDHGLDNETQPASAAA
jgi:hypothetical protein